MKLAVTFFLIFVLCLSVISSNYAFAQSSKTKQETSKKCVGNAYDGVNLKLFEIKDIKNDQPLFVTIDYCLSQGFKIQPFYITQRGDVSFYILLEKR